MIKKARYDKHNSKFGGGEFEGYGRSCGKVTRMSVQGKLCLVSTIPLPFFRSVATYFTFYKFISQHTITSIK